MNKFIFTLLLLFYATSLFSQKMISKQYIVDFLILNNDYKVDEHYRDTSNYSNFELFVEVKSENRKEVNFDLRLQISSKVDYGEDDFFKKIDGELLNVTFNKKKNFFKIKNHRSLTNFEIDPFYKFISFRTCYQSNLRDLIENNFNHYFFFLQNLIFENHDLESLVIGSNVGTTLNYDQIESDNEIVVKFELDPESLDIFCHTIYKCQYDLKIEANEIEIEQVNEYYEAFSDKKKARISRESFVASTIKSQEKNLQIVNDGYFKSYQTCYEIQQNQSLTINNEDEYEKAKITIIRDVPIFQSTSLRNNYKSKFIIQIISND